MTTSDIRTGFGAVRHALAEGWEWLRNSATNALTRFTPGQGTRLPEAGQMDTAWPGDGWAMLGGDVFEDDQRLVVRVEAPGMSKEDFDVQVLGDTLVLRGEKRFQQAQTEGRWRVVQCAYGSFHRTVPLPAAVKPDGAHASYRRGVLTVELPKAAPQSARPRAIPIG